MPPLTDTPATEAQIEDLRREVAALHEAIGAMFGQYENTLSDVKDQFVKFVIETSQDKNSQGGKYQGSHQGDVIMADSGNDGGGKATPYTLRYRNDTERASLGLPVSDPPVHRLEWIAKATPYDPSTITEANPTGDEWANELWNPVLHGDAIP